MSYFKKKECEEEGGMGVFLEHKWHVLTFSKII
jgi:hypothetical protein